MAGARCPVLARLPRPYVAPGQCSFRQEKLAASSMLPLPLYRAVWDKRRRPRAPREIGAGGDHLGRDALLDPVTMGVQWIEAVQPRSAIAVPQPGTTKKRANSARFASLPSSRDMFSW